MKNLSFVLLVTAFSGKVFAAGTCLMTQTLTGAAVDQDTLILSDSSHQNYRVRFQPVCRSLATADEISLIDTSTNGTGDSMLCPGNLILVGSESCWVGDIELVQ